MEYWTGGHLSLPQRKFLINLIYLCWIFRGGAQGLHFYPNSEYQVTRPWNGNLPISVCSGEVITCTRNWFLGNTCVKQSTRTQTIKSNAQPVSLASPTLTSQTLHFLNTHPCYFSPSHYNHPSQAHIWVLALLANLSISLVFYFIKW